MVQRHVLCRLTSLRDMQALAHTATALRSAVAGATAEVHQLATVGPLSVCCLSFS